MSKQFTAVTEFVKVLASFDKEAAKGLVQAVESVKTLDQLPDAMEAFERAGLTYVQAGVWDERTLIVRKSNWRKVAETACTHPEYRAALVQRPVPLQRAYFMALEVTRPKPESEGGEMDLRYRLMGFQRVLRRAMDAAEGMGLIKEARSLNNMLKAVAKAAEMYDVEEITEEKPRLVPGSRSSGKVKRAA